MLARGLRDQETAMAGGALEETMLVRVLRIVLRTNGVIGTQLSHLKGRTHVLVDPS